MNNEWKDNFPKENRYFETDNGILYKGEAIKIMSKFPSEIFDAIITDPPYGTTPCKWDSVIPFDDMWECLKTIRKSNIAIVLFGSEPFSSNLRVSNLKEYKYDWIWKKTKPTGFLHSKNMPLKDYENIMVFSNGVINHKKLTKNRMTYNPQGVYKCTRKIKRTTKGFEGTMESKSQTNEYIGELSGFPKMVLEFNNVISNKTSHPTQKPIELMKYLIKTYTNEGDLVLDFTCGSGTSLVACEKLNRRWVGIELEEKYCEITKQRILKELQNE